ncbi:hypothetical protein Cfor_04838 [Coptotermes formosanus]|jgi:hypothetical protein|uniref:Ionotropic glutamate receptor C-terminal domain-containing protein n=1 Tax=Coptotermes formosanus TaxID=36987 RepID=A0A6L2PJQ9_COPFO|nr:hypothetical protein Cfor_04838 [Coptotermes formosanus]
MKFIFCLAFFLKCPIFVDVTFVNKFGTDYVRDKNAVQDFVLDEVFWSACTSHFHSARILTIVATSWNNEVWNDTVSDVIESVHKNLNIPIILFYLNCFGLVYAASFEFIGKSVDQVREYPAESSHSYLIISYSVESAYSHIYDDTGYPQNKWTQKDNYMILVIFHKSWYRYNSPEMYKLLFHTFWEKYSILNVVTVVKYLNIYDRATDIIVYNPFDANKEGDLIYVTPDHLTQLPKSYLERTWNLAGFVVRVTMFHSFPTAVLKCEESRYKCSYEGRDWEVIKNLATYMNFTPVISHPRHGEGFGYVNGSECAGSVGDLVCKLADISGNERYIKSYDTDKIEFTMPAFYTMQIVVVVPKAHRLPPWRAIFECLTLEFRMYLLAVLLVTTVLWYVLRKLRGKVSCLANAADTIAVFLTMSLSFLTKVSSSSQRLLLSFCLFFSLILMCFFQSTLLDTVSHPRFQPDINTLQKFDESGLPIVTLDPGLLDTFGWSRTMKNLHMKLQYQNLSSQTLLYQMAKYRNVSMLTNKAEALWLLSKYPNRFHIIREYPREYFVSYMIPRGSPYATRIHNLLGKMTEAGLVRKWERDTSYRLELEALREGRANIEDNKNVKVLRLAEFQLSFFMWGIGLTAGAVVFVLERCFGGGKQVYIVK